MILFARFSRAWKWLMPTSDEDPDKAFATPRVTLPQQLALGQAVVAVLIVLGFDLDADTQQLIIGLSALLAAALPASDAAIRRKRSEYADRIATANTQMASAPPAATGALTLSDDDRAVIVDRLIRR